MEHYRIAVVGSGFSGIGMAIRLKREGIDDFVVLERADDVGGTWREQTYPGCGCDIGSRVYSFSFEPNPDWRTTLGSQDEIHAYLKRCVERNGIEPHLRLRCEMLEARWDDDACLWEIETSRGRLSASVLIQATGPMSTPLIPELPGLERFTGTSFHSARWNHDHDITGERVAVVGTGSSSAQIVPAIQPRVAQLKVFQRTPPWVAPKLQRPTTRLERWVYRRFPIAERAARFVLYAIYESLVVALRRPWLMRAMVGRAIWLTAWLHVRDGELRRKLRPDFTIGCKRILRSNDFYRAVTKPNVEVVTAGIRELREHSIVTNDGVEHEVDTIVFATGFYMTDPPIRERVRGRGGVTMLEVFERDGTRALRGTTFSQLPNFFTLVGPNTGTGNNALIVNIESQIHYVLECLRAMQERQVVALEPRREAMEEYDRYVTGLFEGTVWRAGCASHYIDRTGRNVVLWPDFLFRFRRQTRRFEPAEYVLRTANGDASVSSPQARAHGGEPQQAERELRPTAP